MVRYGDSGREDWFLRLVRGFRDRAAAVGAEEGALVCDVASVVEGHPARRDLFIESGLHVTEMGAEVVAEELKRSILAASP